jgi:8-oxo-dGTP pyrophosphatase MutT (NUDIX family)/phosphohistidine phosphatase SixA
VDALVIRAAGGVVWRAGQAGDIEVLLVHRPRFNDWTLPKGKHKRAEHPIRAAVREVHEETGIRAAVGPRLPSVHYDVWSGTELVEKVVDYWAMTVRYDDGHTGNAEVDERSWLPIEAARKRVTYTHDQRVLAAFAALTPPLAAPVVLIRHATAGSRKAWAGPDAQRPLDEAGRARAAALAELLACFAPVRVLSATAERCVQTVRPLATALGLPVEVDKTFDESADPDHAAEALRRAEGPIVVCSQGGLIGPILNRCTGDAVPPPTAKGTGWVLSFSPNGLATMDALSP